MGYWRLIRRAAGALGPLVVASAACSGDRATPIAAPLEAAATAAISASASCTGCLFGPVTLARAAGTPDTTWTFNVAAVPGTDYVAELAGTTGPGGSVALNGATLLSDDSFRRESLSVTLADMNVLRVTLAGMRARSMTLQLRALRPVTLDRVSFAAPPTLVIGGPAIAYDALISNRTATTRNGIDVQGWISQPGANRAAGGQVIYCGLALGLLPPGQCLRPGNGLAVSNTNAGTGTLVPGPAIAVIQVRRQSSDGVRVLDSALVPVTLVGSAVLSVTVLPPDIILPGPGAQQQLIANVATSGGAPTTVTWATSNTQHAVVNSTGLVTGIAKGAALVSAASRFDPSKQGSSLVSVGVIPVAGLGMLVSPGILELSIGQTFRLVAQVPGETGSVTWASSNPQVAVVNASGQATAVADGAALLLAQSNTTPWKKGSALFAVGTTAASGNGVNIAPAFWRMPVGRTVRMAAQLVGDTGSVQWYSTNTAVAWVDAIGNVTGVAPGTASIIAQSKTDASKSATATIAVADFRFTAPIAATLVSTGATLPAANPLTTTVQAQSCGPSGTYTPDFMRVDFAAGGRPMGSVAFPMPVDNGVTRCWTWTLNWTPGTAFGTGVQYIVARGYDALNRPVILGPNTFITITDP